MCYISSHLASNPCFSGLASDDKDIAEQTTVRDGELYTYMSITYVSRNCVLVPRGMILYFGGINNCCVRKDKELLKLRLIKRLQGVDRHCSLTSIFAFNFNST